MRLLPSSFRAYSPRSSRAAEIELTLQTRDPATGRVILTQEQVDPRHVGVIAVDVEFSLVQDGDDARGRHRAPYERGPRRRPRLGMTVMLCPSDVVDNYVGYPQREAVFAQPRFLCPKVMR